MQEEPGEYARAVLAFLDEGRIESAAHAALRQAREWMFEHLERTEGLAAIYPAMMNAIFALVALGHSPDDPLTAREIEVLQLVVSGASTSR